MKGISMRFLATSLVFLGCIGVLGYGIQRDQTLHLLFLYGLSFGSFLILYRLAQSDIGSIRYFVALGFLARVLLLGSWPALSEDFARFLWDGYLALHGISPYEFTPETLIAQEEFSDIHFLTTLFPLLNSPDYFSIYPPVNQLIFAFSVLVGNSSVFEALICLRVMLILSEGLIAWMMSRLLGQLGLSPKRLLLYLLNPLVILEIAGNLHFEGLMLLSLLISLWFFNRRPFLSGSWFGFAISIKLTPLLLAPMLLAKNSSYAGLFSYVFGLLLILGCCMFPIYPFQESFFSSFRLYYGKFEFNASIYYLIRDFSIYWLGYNPIRYVTPALSAVAGLIILFLGVSFRIKLNIYKLTVISYLIYLLLHAVVHPWYIILPLGISVFTNYKVMHVWSACIFLSYAAYQSVPVTELSWVIIVQYLAVLFFFYKDIRNFNIAKTIP